MNCYTHDGSPAVGMFNGSPVVHICAGVDPVTRRPRVARGVVAIGNFAVGAVAVGGVTMGYAYAVGGVAVGPAIIDATHCDEAARRFAERWMQFASAVRSCR